MLSPRTLLSGKVKSFTKDDIDGLVQDCSNSIASALELLQSCTEQSILIYLGLYSRTENNNTSRPVTHSTNNFQSQFECDGEIFILLSSKFWQSDRHKNCTHYMTAVLCLSQ